MATDSDHASSDFSSDEEYFSCHSEPEDNDLGLSGYLFEPELSSKDENNNGDSSTVDSEEAARIGNTDW